MAKTAKVDVDALKKQLHARCKELGRLMDAHESEQDPVVPNQGDMGRLTRMDAIQVQAMAEETARRRDLELGRIEAALKRIEDGEYGECAGCGEAIAPKRLENDPAAAVCVACAGRAERG